MARFAKATGGTVPPWERPGPKLSAWIERWRQEREPGPWPRATRPSRDLFAARHQVLGGHTNSVSRVAWGPHGRLASATSDGTVRVWDPGAQAPEVERYEAWSFDKAGSGDRFSIEPAPSAQAAEGARFRAQRRGGVTELSCDSAVVATLPVSLFLSVSPTDEALWAAKNGNGVLLYRRESA